MHLGAGGDDPGSQGERLSVEAKDSELVLFCYIPEPGRDLRDARFPVAAMSGQQP